MGNDKSTEQSQLPKSPLIISIRNTLKLKFLQGNLTRSLVYQAFANRFVSLKDGIMERRMNPFCVLQLNQDQENYDSREWVTCCMVSPMMAVASPIYICRKDATFYRSCRVRGLNKDSDVFVEVKDIIHLDAHHVVLLVLKEPLWELGWAGIAYLKDPKEIESGAYKLVNHPQRKRNIETEETRYIQKVVTPYLKSSQNSYKANNKDETGSIICKIVDRKPYIVGVQISNVNALFFDEQLIGKAQQRVGNYLIKENREKEFIKQMDLNRYEEEIEW